METPVVALLSVSAIYVNLLGLLVVDRLLHYLGITEMGPIACRPVGQVATLSVLLVSSLWLSYSALASIPVSIAGGQL